MEVKKRKTGDSGLKDKLIQILESSLKEKMSQKSLAEMNALRISDISVR
jgi:hypothetical protein